MFQLHTPLKGFIWIGLKKITIKKTPIVHVQYNLPAGKISVLKKSHIKRKLRKWKITELYKLKKQLGILLPFCPQTGKTAFLFLALVWDHMLLPVCRAFFTRRAKSKKPWPSWSLSRRGATEIQPFGNNYHSSSTSIWFLSLASFPSDEM